MIIVLSVLCSIAIYNFFTVVRLEKASPLEEYPKVSLLIPVRNERERLSGLLLSISEIRYPNLEVLFLDDESTDGTFEILDENKEGRLGVRRGKALPDGWLGKSWACWQLAGEATGEIFLFCDADVRMSPDSIQKTVSSMNENKVQALTALPYQELPTWYEKSVVPFVMHLPIFSLVPLKWVPRLQRPSLVVANGQWFAIQREAYFKVDGHRSCAQSLIEDMALGRNLVSHGFRLLPVLAVKDIRVRMYDSWESLKEGFTKNLYDLSGGHSISVMLVLLGSLAIYNFPGWDGVGLLILLRAVVALAFGASFSTLLYHPVGSLLFAFLLVRSWVFSVTGRITWKGRGTQPRLTS